MTNALRGWEIFNRALAHNSTAISRSREGYLIAKQNTNLFSCLESGKANLLGSGEFGTVVTV